MRRFGDSCFDLEVHALIRKIHAILVVHEVFL